MKRFILLDTHAIIHRAYHALPPLLTPSGEPAGAVYGFTTILLRILRELKPDYIAAAFDLPGATFRHIAYERYKAQRPATPSDLASQFLKVREVLEAFGIPVYLQEGYEADDIIGTIVKKLEKKKDCAITIVTGDLDVLQLVRPNVSVYYMKKGITETITYDVSAVHERYGFDPEQIPDFKGLKGDPSDNIAGVKGIGEKTALNLIQSFGTIGDIYKALKKNSKKISSSSAAKLRAGEKDAYLSRDLATIKKDVPITVRLEDVAWNDTHRSEKVKRLFQKFGFFSLLKRLDINEKPTAVQAALSMPVAEKTFLPETLVTPADFTAFVSAYSRGPCGVVLLEKELYIIPKTTSRVGLISPDLFKNAAVKKFFQTTPHFFVYDGKALIHFLRGHDIECGTPVFDLMLAAYLTNTFSRDFSFAAIFQRELGRPAASDPREELIHFFEVVSLVDAKLNEGRLRNVFETIELPLVRILADMEDRGIMLDRSVVERCGDEIDTKLSGFTKNIYTAAGEEFNINSSQQLSRILFEKLGIATHGLRKTQKGGVVSTNAAELEKLRGAHPIVAFVLEYRELMKLKTTYVDALPGLVNVKTGRIHTTFNQTGTATGRLSSVSPNMQNIPIMSEYGRRIRSAFVASAGYSLASFDYSQIELRIAAHMARDAKMIDAFKKGLDIHALTASEINNIPLESVTPELRRAAKTLNFGILYGMGAQALAEVTEMTREEARRYIDEYFRDFSGIKKYIADTLASVREKGYAETIFGRRRYIPEIFSSNWQLKREAERMAVNAPIQGSATGDIIKLAMIQVDTWIRKEKMDDEVRMLLQVHDELLFEIKSSIVKEVTPRIKKIMEHVASLDVPLVVGVTVGERWGK